MILACASPTADRIQEAEEPISMVLLQRARRLLQRKLFDADFRIDGVARELGVSRTRLYRLFEPYGGVAHYLQRRRLIDAHAVLADPCDQRRIVDIAEQRCFTDGAEFSRAFRREFGYTPSDVRTGIHGGLPNRPATDLAANKPEERFGLLLRKLHG
jgi:AraC-like DNA-binding protein